MCKETKIIAVFFVVLALGAGNLRAEIIEINITAEIDYIDDLDGLLNGQLGVGDILSGSYIYDSATPDSDPSPSIGSYRLYSPPYGISLSRGGFTLQTDPDNVEFWLGVRNDDPWFDPEINEDYYGLISYNNLPLYDNVSVGHISWQLDDSTGTALSSTALPTTPPVLEDWDFDWGIRITGGIPDEEGKFIERFMIIAPVTFVELVPYQPKIYYVDATDGSDDNDGLTPETAFATIQKAIDSSFNGDTVIVADGTYTGPGNRDIDFLGKAITVRSENGPENCIIDCNGTEIDPHLAFYFSSGEDADSVLDGLTITNGYTSGAGGIYCMKMSSPTITNCIVRNNMAGEGGGGGIRCRFNSSPIISNCKIINNTTISGWGGAGICSSGWTSNNPIITNCIITGNSSESGGGGICCWYGSPTITNCTISGNSALIGGGMFYGADSPTITNCTITGNSADIDGGGISCQWGSDLVITNCILWNNTAPKGNEISALYTEFHEKPYLSTVTVNYSNVEGGFLDAYVESGCTLNWGQGNINTDPYFIDPGYWADANDPNIVVEPNDPNAVWVEGDYHLLPNSPCIDAGDPNFVAEPNETDLDGNPRIRGDAIDMGAYETIIHEARLLVLPRVINRKSRQPRIMAWVNLPQGITKDQIDTDIPLVLYPGGIKAMRQFVFQNRRRGPASIFAVFDKAELMDAMPANGRLELQVLGYLSQPGQYFSGCDTIRIIPRLSKPQRQRKQIVVLRHQK